MLARILETIVANPLVYDLVQRIAGREQNYRRLMPFLTRAKGDLLLDAGGGTGEIARILDPTIRYLWIDNDTQKLAGFRRKYKHGWAVVGDLTRIPLAPASVHTALCVGVSHHLTDGELKELFSGLARVCRNQLIFLDPLEQKDSTISNFMWRYDRGRYARTAECLISMLEQYFVLEETQRYSIYHHYLLCIARPAGTPA